jgi:hypothetical protein
MVLALVISTRVSFNSSLNMSKDSVSNAHVRNMSEVSEVNVRKARKRDSNLSIHLNQ